MIEDILSGFSRSIVGYPFDIIRYNLQTQPYENGKGLYYKNSYDCIQKIGIKGLYKGILPFSIGNSLLLTIHFQIYALCLLNFKYINDNKYLSNFLYGMNAGIFGSIINTPMEHIRIKLTKRESPHINSIDIFKKLYSKGNIKLIYKGFVITTLRDAIGYGSFFLTKEYLDVNIKKNNKFRSIIIGVGSGFGLWLSMFPLDTIKTNIQSCSLTKTKTIHSVFNEIYQKNGLLGFYKGVGPCLLRAIPVNISIIYIQHLFGK